MFDFKDFMTFMAINDAMEEDKPAGGIDERVGHRLFLLALARRHLDVGLRIGHRLFKRGELVDLDAGLFQLGGDIHRPRAKA